MASTTPKSQQLDLSTLPPQQLLQIKKQLDDELEHLNASFTQLRGAQAKFGECLRCLDSSVVGRGVGRGVGKGGDEEEEGEEGEEGEGGKERILVPLTSSLYVPGVLVGGGKVVVDVGTGFYVEKSTADAKTFYTSKVKELGASLKDLEGILGGKGNNLRVVEDVLRQKMSEAEAQALAAEAAAA